ncbi:MAG: hypothetical protein HQL35_04855 [Alphaproteobacteria bacterium]|nr:hypothetical protein [Alphaproteobacteria bacterium]
MTEPNIDLFNRYTAIIFADLYKAFPVGIKLEPCDIVVQYPPPKEMPDISLEVQTAICAGTIQWLEGAGYIKIANTNRRLSGNLTFTNVVLTVKGLEVLKGMPDSLGNPAGEQLLSAMKTGGAEAGKTLISLAITSAWAALYGG